MVRDAFCPYYEDLPPAAEEDVHLTWSPDDEDPVDAWAAWKDWESPKGVFGEVSCRLGSLESKKRVTKARISWKRYREWLAEVEEVERLFENLKQIVDDVARARRRHRQKAGIALVDPEAEMRHCYDL